MTDWTDPDTFAQVLEDVETKERGATASRDFEEGTSSNTTPALRSASSATSPG